MSLSVRNKPYFVPEYSLTGDLLSYLNCGLQYRYYNKGSLPPSKPVQLWFGEFIHGVMEDAYLEWDSNPSRKKFPWSWSPDIRDIEVLIWRRLAARKMNPPPTLYCWHDSSYTKKGVCPDINHPHKLYASERAEEAINTWGQHLFPLIKEAEVKLKGTREMPNFAGGPRRSDYYSVTGRIDVLSSVKLQEAPSGNLILHYLENEPNVKTLLNKLQTPEYEIIIDYKGMRRPPSKTDPSWLYHQWQLLTYAWLRSKQPDAKPIIAGIIFYLNELAPSKGDLDSLKDDVKNKNTDIDPSGSDMKQIMSWTNAQPIPPLSQTFKERRSIRIIPIQDADISTSLTNFDKAVDEIEESVSKESSSGSITTSWKVKPVERNCTVCDFKTFCPNPAPRQYTPTVP